MFVVLRICTLLGMDDVVGVATPLFAANVLNCLAEDTVPVSDRGVRACSEEACEWDCCFFPICGVSAKED